MVLMSNCTFPTSPAFRILSLSYINVLASFFLGCGLPSTSCAPMELALPVWVIFLHANVLICLNADATIPTHILDVPNPASVVIFVSATLNSQQWLEAAGYK